MSIHPWRGTTRRRLPLSNEHYPVGAHVATLIGLDLRLEVAPPEIRIDRDTPLSPEWYVHTDDQTASSERALAFVEGDPVGAIWFRQFGARAIAGVFVVPDFRGAGIAKQLVEFALCEMDCAASDLESTSVVTPEGAALMRSFGARVHGPCA